MNPAKVYNDTIAASPAPYRGLLIDFGQDNDGTYFVMMYKDNLAEFPTHQQQEITNWLSDFVRRLNDQGMVSYYVLSI